MKLLISWIAIANLDISVKVMFEPDFSNWVSMFLSALRACVVFDMAQRYCNFDKQQKESTIIFLLFLFDCLGFIAKPEILAYFQNLDSYISVTNKCVYLLRNSIYINYGID